jgi:hypothetical protein
MGSRIPPDVARASICMKFLFVWSAATIAIGIVLGMGIYRLVWGREALSSAARSSVESVTLESTGNGSEVWTLKQKVAELRAQVMALNAQLWAKKPVAPETPVQAKAVQGDRSARTDEWRDHVETVEDDFRHEPMDATWSSSATAALQAAIHSNEGVRAAPSRKVECRSRTCRVEIADDGSGQVMQAMPALAMEFEKTFPSHISNRVDDGKGNHSLVFYVSRDDGASVKPPSR